MRMKGLCLNFKTCGSNIQKVTLITPSKVKFHLIQYYIITELHPIRQSYFSSPGPPDIPSCPFLKGVWRFKSGYFILKPKIIQLWFRQCTQIGIVGLMVLAGSAGLSNRVIRCIVYLLHQLLYKHIWCERMLYQIQSLVYGLSIILWI